MSADTGTTGSHSMTTSSPGANTARAVTADRAHLPGGSVHDWTPPVVAWVLGVAGDVRDRLIAASRSVR